MKLMNFRRFDPEYTSQGKSGLTNGGKQEEEIWNEFFNNPTGLEEAVRSIKSGEAIYAQSTWIFQGNPDIFNVNAYLEEQFAAAKPINWVVRQHRSKVKTWDLVYIWRSAGKLRAESGVVARAVVLTDPEVLPDDREDLWTDELPTEELRVQLKLEDVRLGSNEGMLLADSFTSDPTLSQMRILKMRSETNYLLSAEESLRLNQLWGVPAELPSLNLSEDAFSEGKKIERIHVRRERNRRLIALAKARFTETHGKLFCEACGFNAQAAYGLDTEALIEAHHTVPISELEPGSLTRIEDLTMLCPNCHRAIHHRRPWLSVAELRAKVTTPLPHFELGSSRAIGK